MERKLKYLEQYNSSTRGAARYLNEHKSQYLKLRIFYLQTDLTYIAFCCSIIVFCFV